MPSEPSVETLGYCQKKTLNTYKAGRVRPIRQRTDSLRRTGGHAGAPATAGRQCAPTKETTMPGADRNWDGAD